MHTINDILVVDDDPAVVEMVIDGLRTAGWLCCAAYDGESAMLAIAIARPALVLLDVHLPGLTGLEVVTELRRHGLADVPIVLMTGDVDAAAQLHTSAFPACLLKPFAVTTLLHCVGRAIAPRQQDSSVHAHRAVGEP